MTLWWRGMKINTLLIKFIVISYTLMGCQQEELSKTAMVAKEYLEEQGYNVLSYEHHQERYKITKSKLEILPYSFYWAVPGNNAEPFMGMVVDVEKFLVNHHPLDDWECCDGVKSNGKVYTYVYVIEGKVVGGTSFPSLPKDNEVIGGYWSLDGRTEE